VTTDNGRSLATTIAGQHASVRRLFAEATDASTDVRGARFADLARYLAIHEAAEQTFLHRLDAEQDAAAEAGGVVQQRLDEEQEASTLVVRLEQLGPDDPAFLTQLGLLEEAVEQHAAREERDELPLLEGALAPGQLAAVQDGVGLVDELYAGRGSGASVPVDGGFVAQYDAARAAFRGAGPRGAITHEKD
jgi:hypothetical protein